MTIRAFVPRVFRALVLLGGLALLVAGGLSIRVWVAGRAALDRAEAAFDRGELEEAIRQAQRAATLQLPGAAHVDQAYLRL
ncbi:MAG TPA: hypothetical protein VFQ61_25110, partial [Polyangiaceae bacterium]|nr:hypothetical protein [Polyangiaceae bacterium]